MISEETKIKDLPIPDGYEMDGTQIWDRSKDGEFAGLFIPFKKKMVKDWNWYVENYLKNLNMWISDNEIVEIEKHIKSMNHVIPFEIKLGLLKFICDDIQEDYIFFLSYCNQKHDLTDKGELMIDKIKSICPAEFLKLIFEV